MNFKNLLFHAAILGSVVMFSSCALTKPTLENTAQIKYRDVTGIVNHMPVTADLQVSNTKVQGVFVGKATVVKNGKEQSIEWNEDACKDRAVVDALEKLGADILISPMFTIEKIDKQITVKVTGYPATYKNFRPATIQDKEILELWIDPASKAAHKSEATVKAAK